MKKRLFALTAIVLVVVMMMVVLCACAPNSNPDKALKALKKHDYVATKASKSIIASDVSSVVTGYNSDGDYIMIFYFDSKDAADNAWSDIQSFSDKTSQSKDKEDDWVCNKSGKIIYFGTKAAVKAAA